MNLDERLERLERLVLGLIERVETLDPDEGLSSLEQQRRTSQARERKEG